MAKTHYTTREVAAILGMTTATVLNYVKRKALQAKRIERGPHKIDGQSLKRFLDKNAVPHFISGTGEIIKSG